MGSGSWVDVINLKTRQELCSVEEQDSSKQQGRRSNNYVNYKSDVLEPVSLNGRTCGRGRECGQQGRTHGSVRGICPPIKGGNPKGQNGLKKS